MITMDIPDLHGWEVSSGEAIEIQRRLKEKVVLERIKREIRYSAGLDVSYAKGSRTIWGGVVVLDFPSLCQVEQRWAQSAVSFPYIPGAWVLPHIWVCFYESLPLAAQNRGS